MMQQWIKDCDEHADCVVIESEGWPDKVGSWRSHDHKDVDVAGRLNPDMPKAHDHRAGAKKDAKVVRKPAR